MAAVTQYYSKWDKFAAELSDDEPAVADVPAQVAEAPDVVGKGQALTGALLPAVRCAVVQTACLTHSHTGLPLWPCHVEDGRIQAVDRPGNARGNGLGGNAAPPRELPLQQYTWTDAAGVVTLTVPLPHLARGGKGGEATGVETVTCSFGPLSLDLRVLSAAHDARLFVLHLDNLPCGGIQAEVCLVPHAHSLGVWTADSSAAVLPLRRAATTCLTRGRSPGL
jgi:hypothetical protein